MDVFYSENEDNSNIRYDNIAKGAINEFRSDLGKVNILIAGKTGVGKSTLINAIFKKDLAITGEGAPITQDITEFSSEGFPISIIDTKGLELKDYNKILDDLKEYIAKRQNSDDAHTIIHAAWVCIAEGSSRIEIAEKDLVKMLSEYMPVIIVITKTTYDQGLQGIIRKECPKAKAVIRVQAKSIQLDDGYVIKPKNLEELARLTNEYLPASMENAFVSAQKVSLELKEIKSKLIIAIFKKDASVAKKEIDLIVVGIRMITVISGIFGLELEDEFIVKISVVIFGDKKSKLKKMFNKILKFVPGVHTKPTAEQKSLIMESIGNMYLESLLKACQNKKNGEKPSEHEIKYLLIELCQKYFDDIK